MFFSFVIECGCFHGFKKLKNPTSLVSLCQCVICNISALQLGEVILEIDKCGGVGFTV